MNQSHELQHILTYNSKENVERRPSSQQYSGKKHKFLLIKQNINYNFIRRFYPHSMHILQAKIQEFEESAKSTTNAAQDKACDAADQAQCQAHKSQEETAGFLQQVLQFFSCNIKFSIFIFSYFCFGNLEISLF